ncbi:Zcf18 transcription factor [Candida orthopsilosis Co 90-125]|uniref:Zcf18 transcription factor n=1 Tax=Candida orthopsilosis (strain 90-125) TaxID=1136231 RepID=H8X8Q2_CANO9|nr:Zcf18 transcription factor [Candida orthopsilosis Co 90-125]CCG24527.1 Zcf18 transcription factor [Candida orthopsilosis Co 90-125]
MSTNQQPRNKRSRNGCLSCKQLKIKCNEAKPACEYCVHTQRECVYAAPKSKAPLKWSHRVKKPSTSIEVLETSTASTTSTTPTSMASPFLEVLDSDTTSPSTTSTSPLFDEERTPSSILFGGQFSPRTKALLLQRDYYAPPTHMDYLTRSLMLNQTSTLLGISRFELRLLKFFDMHCINLFSFGVNEGIHNAWKYKVPHLFLESELVRQSMFSFAAVALSTTLPLQDIQRSDNEEDIFDALAREDASEFDTMTRNNIYLKTTTHFLTTLAKAQEKINEVQTSNSFTDPTIAKELTVSSILIFSFLGVQPHGLIKLISFNQDEEETDMIAISRGSRDIVLNCASTILESELSGLLFFRVNQDLYSPPLKECEYPIIKYLLLELYRFQDSTNEEVVNDTSSSYQTLKLALDCLNKALFGCGYYKFPIPLFRFLMVIPEDFRSLLYAKHKYALKVLYVYAALCFIARFQMYKEYSIWRDFVVWYKDEVKLVDKVERNLYHLVVDQCYVIPNYEDFPYFDPLEGVCGGGT